MNQRFKQQQQQQALMQQVMLQQQQLYQSGVPAAAKSPEQDWLATPEGMRGADFLDEDNK